VNRFEKDYMAHYSDGTKHLINADSTAEAEEKAQSLCPAGATISFITHAAGDIPFSYDWDDKLQKWQGTLF
jgi:hypothetical protein